MITMRTGNMAGQERPKREVVLWDPSGDAAGSFVEVTLWGDKAHMEFTLEGVLFAKMMRVGEWQGRATLTATQNTSMEADPDHPKAIELVQKYHEAGKPRFVGAPSVISGGSGISTTDECREDELKLGPPPIPGQRLEPGQPPSVQRHTVLGTIVYLQDRAPFYAACPELVDRMGTQGMDAATQMNKRMCNKKTEQDGTVWRCSMGHSCSQPQYRYLCRLKVADHTGSLDVSCFDDSAKTLFGINAEAVASAYAETTRMDEYQQMMRKPLFRRGTFRLRSMRETFNEEERVKYVVGDDVGRLIHASDARRMLSDIKAAVGPF